MDGDQVAIQAMSIKSIKSDHTIIAEALHTVFLKKIPQPPGQLVVGK